VQPLAQTCQTRDYLILRNIPFHAALTLKHQHFFTCPREITWVLPSPTSHNFLEYNFSTRLKYWWHFGFSWRRVWRWLPSGVLRRVEWLILTEVSEELTVSIIIALMMVAVGSSKSRSIFTTLHNATSQKTATSRPGDRLSWQRVFVVFLSTSKLLR
jgi:hypothetical protein